MNCITWTTKTHSINSFCHHRFLATYSIIHFCELTLYWKQGNRMQWIHLARLMFTCQIKLFTHLLTYISAFATTTPDFTLLGTRTTIHSIARNKIPQKHTQNYFFYCVFASGRKYVRRLKAIDTTVPQPHWAMVQWQLRWQTILLIENKKWLWSVAHFSDAW